MSFSRPQTTWVFFFPKKTWPVVSRLRWHDPIFQQIDKWQQNGNVWVHFAVVSQRRYPSDVPQTLSPNQIITITKQKILFSPASPVSHVATLSAGQAGAALVISAPLSCNTKAASGERVRGEPVRLGEGYKMRCVTLPWHPPKSIGSRYIWN